MNQHTKPCKTCPFARTSKPGALGGSSPPVFIGQAEAGMWLPCHSAYNPDRHYKNQRPDETPQCAGAAIMRKNVNASAPFDMMPISVESDVDSVFATYAEFIAHHAKEMGVTCEIADSYLNQITPQMLAQIELAKAKIMAIRKKPSQQN